MLLEDLIFEVVSSRFRYDVDFFSRSELAMYPATWSRFKNKKVSILDMRYGRVSVMLDLIFSPLELQLISELEVEYKNQPKESRRRYYLNKKALLREWADSNKIKKISRKSYSLPNGGESPMFFLVKKDKYNYLYFNFKDKEQYSQLINKDTIVDINFIFKNIDNLH